MKIIMIRHGKVNMTWEGSYDSKGYDEAVDRYDHSPLLEYAGKKTVPKGYRIYISALQRTYDTAMQIFDFPKEELEGNPVKGPEDFIRTPLLNEVPKRSFKDTNVKYPKAWWTGRCRIQWFFNSKRQPETRRETVKRAEELVDLLESRGEDAVLISHEFFLYTLKGILEERGFIIERSNLFRIKNWERIRASKRSLHCGVCGHNCLLTNPGCNVGKDAAKMQGIKTKNE